MTSGSLQRLVSVARKEWIHIFRDPMTLFFTLFIPIIELFMLGYAIDTNVRHVRTVILDHAGTQESRQLLQKFESNSMPELGLVLFSCAASAPGPPEEAAGLRTALAR